MTKWFFWMVNSATHRATLSFSWPTAPAGMLSYNFLYPLRNLWESCFIGLDSKCWFHTSFCFNFCFVKSWAVIWPFLYSRLSLPPPPLHFLSSPNFSLSDDYDFPEALGEQRCLLSPRLITKVHKEESVEGGDVLGIITNNSKQSFLHRLMLKCIRSTN